MKLCKIKLVKDAVTFRKFVDNYFEHKTVR